MRNDRSLAWNAAEGALAGAMASQVMNQVTSFLYSHEDAAALAREEQARGGRPAFAIAAEKLASLAGRTLDEAQRERLGSALHWGVAVGTGALYGVLRRRLSRARVGAGLLFGAAVWLIVDEWLNVALRFTPGPRAFPWQAHARGLAGHLAFGVATELELQAADRAARAS